jgi:phosphorylcholine metabolism protein LicD
MEQELINFDDWVRVNQNKEIEYWAVYDNDGRVLGVYPENSVINKNNKILIDPQTAENIRQGTTYLHHCYVDVIKQKFFVTEEVSNKDNVLHRVPYRQWSSRKYFDFYIDYFSKEQTIILSLTERFSGTRVDDISKLNSKIFNDRNTEILLYITDYNDPNVLYYTLTLSLSELYNSEKEFKNINLPKNFSVYTKRYFEDYVLDVK